MIPPVEYHHTTFPPEHFAGLKISEISTLGSQALQDCLQHELRERGLWDKTQVPFAFNLAMDLHAGQMRKDGPYQDHITRVGLWCVREFDTHDVNIAIAAIMHDAVEDHPEGLQRQFQRPGMKLDGTDREQALQVLEQGRIFIPTVNQAIGCLTCPSFKDCNPLEKNMEYAWHIMHKIAANALAKLVKGGDNIENVNGNGYNPDAKMRRRLDTKYFPVSALFSRFVNDEDSLIPQHRRDFVIDTINDGHERARQRLQTEDVDSKGNIIPAMSDGEIQALDTLGGQILELADHPNLKSDNPARLAAVKHQLADYFQASVKASSLAA